MIRILSTPMIYAPGFVAAMRRVGHLSEEAGAKAASLYMLANAFPDAPGWALMALAEGRYSVDAESESVLVERAGVVIDLSQDAPTESTVIGGAL